MKTRALPFLLLLAAPAAAHDYWLMPAALTPPPGQAVAVKLLVGEDALADEERDWQPDRTPVLDLVTAAGRTELRTKDRTGQKPAVLLTPPRAGTAVLRMDRDWSKITLKADKFEAYLKEEGFTDAIRGRAAAGETGTDGRERYRRCLKAILHAPGADPDDTPTKPLGQLLEIVPGKNPYRLKAGDGLPVKLLFLDKPLAGVKLSAHHRADGTHTAVAVTTAADGTAVLKLPWAGPWVVRCVHMRRCTDDPTCDWESYWAAVTFAVP